MDRGTSPARSKAVVVGRHFASLGVLWSIILLGVFLADMSEDRTRTDEIATIQARSALEGDLVYRRWAGMNGAVWVPATDSMPPRPDLADSPDREIVTPSGRRLTLVDPASMTRLVHDLAGSDHGIRGRITSLDPTRPENAPSPWEEEALRAMVGGAVDYVERQTLDGSPYLSVMIPLFTEEYCLQCHEEQGHEPGDLQGGLTASVPLEALLAAERRHVRTGGLTLFVVWLFGLVGLGFSLRSVRDKIETIDQARRLLADSQSQLTQAQRLGRMGHFVFDVQAGTWTCSENLALLLGISPAAEYQFDEWLGVVHPDDRSTMLAYVQEEVLAPAKPFDREYRIRRPADGVDRWVQGHGELEVDADGNVLTMFGTIQDITERKKVEDRSRSDEARLRALVDLFQTAQDDPQSAAKAILHQAVHLTSSQGGCLMLVNPSGDYTDHTTEFALGEEARCLAREAGVLDEVIRSREAVSLAPGAHGDSHLMVVPVLHADELVAVCSVHGRETAYTSDDEVQVVLLIEEGLQSVVRARAEEALRVSEERFTRLARNVPDVMYNVRVWPEPGLTYISPAVNGITGHTPEEIYADPALAWRIIHRDDRASLQGLIAGSVPPGVPLLLRWVRQDGELVWTELRSVPIHDDEGRMVALEGVARDVTERVHAEQEHDRLQRELLQAQKIESVGRLAGGVAHDFNNMLGVIVGHAELAKEDVQPGSALEHDLDAILDAGRRSAELTKQLLTFARQQTIEPRPLELNEVVGGVFSMLRRMVREEIDLQWEPGSDLWQVKLDPAQVDQLLINLVVNAGDAIPGQGRISIATRNVVVDDIPFADASVLDQGEYVELTVEDTGVGMPEEVSSRVFEPFFTTKEQGHGTGLGLATVYGIVRQNSGWIDIESEVGKGSLFRVRFPRTEVRSEAGDREEDPVDTPHGEGTVLVVEDEAALLMLTAEMLRREGYEVLGAASPTEALNLAEDFPDEISLLLTDVVMPGSNGLQLAEDMQRSRPALRVLFMSGYPDRVLTEKGVLRAGVRLIQKPFTRQALRQAVSETIQSDD